MKKRIIAILVCICSVFALLGLCACTKEDAVEDDKGIVGISSEKTYIRGNFYVREPVFRGKILELPIVSGNEITIDEIDDVTVHYKGADNTLSVSGYRLSRLYNAGEYNYYTLYIYMMASAVYSLYIYGITVTINGVDYVFSADVLVGCANLYPENFTNPQIYLASGANGEAQLWVTRMGSFTLNSIFFQSSWYSDNGFEITDIKLETGDGEYSDVVLPQTYDGENLKFLLTYTEPTDCLYYGIELAMNITIGDTDFVVTNAVSLETNIRFTGSAFYGL